MNNTTDRERRGLWSSQDDQDGEEDDVSLESYFNGMKDEDFINAVDKLTTKDKK
jgi:hypothetical protein